MRKTSMRQAFEAAKVNTKQGIPAVAKRVLRVMERQDTSVRRTRKGPVLPRV